MIVSARSLETTKKKREEGGGPQKQAISSPVGSDVLREGGSDSIHDGRDSDPLFLEDNRN